jgi:hypothetical protein
MTRYALTTSQTVLALAGAAVLALALSSSLGARTEARLGAAGQTPCELNLQCP